jgi:riboflavin kinase / FMN adenylyltransferase
MVLANSAVLRKMTGMSVITLHWMDPPQDSLSGSAVTVGNFDGVHLGHQQLIRTARRWADHYSGPCLAVTFDPPPVELLNPTLLRAPLSTLSERCEWLHQAGADHVVVLQTDAGLLSLSPEAFFEDVLQRFLGAKAVVEGYNFCFGRGRAGDTKLLAEMCRTNGMTFEELPPLLHEGQPVSSSRVRQEIAQGNIREAAKLLGRPYSITGQVVPGAQRGRTIGFPTANLAGIGKLLPSDGVYAVLAWLDGKRIPAATNIGPAPTFGEQSRKVEVHLIDFQGDIYGQTLKVEFVAKLRDTRPFSGIAELTAQLKLDVKQARELTSN